MRPLLKVLPSICCSLFFATLVAGNEQPDSPLASPVDARIAAAQKQVDAKPTSPTAFTDLAFALIRKGRDSQDESTYLKAGTALYQTLKLSPDNYDARKLQAAIMLVMNQPAEALKLATALNHKVPDDLAGWGLLVDANIALGNYDQAEHASQWILDLRPGSSLGFEKAAGLRELFGDAEGSVDFLDEATRRSSQNDADQRAWLLTQKARLILAAGNAKGAAEVLAQATLLFPDSQLVLAGLAKVRMAEGNFADAATLLKKRYDKVPSAANLYDWAEALSKAGQEREASNQFASFEKRGASEGASSHSTELRLIDYYSDRKAEPAQALSLASKAAATRQDSATLEAYAWALYRNGKFAEAKVQMDKALAVGIRRPDYFCHAAQIAAMANDNAAVEHYKKEMSGMPASPCLADAPLQTASEVRQ